MSALHPQSYSACHYPELGKDAGHVCGCINLLVTAVKKKKKKSCWALLTPASAHSVQWVSSIIKADSTWQHYKNYNTCYNGTNVSYRLHNDS